MFKYPKATNEKISPSPREGREGLANPPLPRPSGDVSAAAPAPEKKDVSPEALRELLEKNLKWSQIIYEQTRKINSKLFWKSVFGWVMLFIFVIAPTALSIWYLPSLIKNIQDKYLPVLSLLGSTQQVPGAKGAGSVDDILKLLPVSEEQKAILKTMLQPK